MNTIPLIPYTPAPGELIIMILLALGLGALTILLAKGFTFVFLRAQKRWENRSSLQRKLARWDCVRPRNRAA